MSDSTRSSFLPVCLAITRAMRSRILQDLLGLDGDVRRLATGPAGRLVDHEARVGQADAAVLRVPPGRCALPALATQPVPTVVTGARTKRIMSWMASPDSTCPPGDEISIRDRRIRRPPTRRAGVRQVARRELVVDLAEHQHEARLEGQLLFQTAVSVGLGGGLVFGSGELVHGHLQRKGYGSILAQTAAAFSRCRHAPA
jgi:hypothetical protein